MIMIALVMTHRFLGNKRDLLPIFLNVDFIDRLVIKKNLADKGIVETLDQLNPIKLSISTSVPVNLNGLTQYSSHNHWRQQAQHMCLVQP